MADKLMRAQVTLPRVTGVPEDAITNTFYFDGDDGFANDADYHTGVFSGLQAFYQAFDGYLSTMLAGTATVKIYDMRDATPRVPEYTNTFNLTLGSEGWLPAETAICCSFQAAATSGTSQRRRRGRVYLGPFTVNAAAQSAGDLRPVSTVRGIIATAATALSRIDVVGEGAIRWAVYSPTTDTEGATVDDSFHDVANGWVDNAFDTQRRRGSSPSSRDLWTAEA